MLGKAEWFGRRKYTGWGLTPKTWQGWAYMIVILGPFIVFHSIGNWSEEVKLGVTGVWIAFVVLDAIDMMMHLKKDERETIHEAIAERNAAWFMVAVLAIGLAYETITHALQNEFYVNPILAIALFGAVIIKAATNIYLERKD